MVALVVEVKIESMKYFIKTLEADSLTRAIGLGIMRNIFCLRQKFPCHRLLMSIASTYFRSRLRNPEEKWILFDETNPEAFKEVVNFIYHKRHFKIQNGGLGSSFSYIKLVLEVLCLAVKFRLRKLVKFCEEVVEKKINLTSANSQQVQDPSKIIPNYVVVCLGKPIVTLTLCISELCRSISSTLHCQ